MSFEVKLAALSRKPYDMTPEEFRVQSGGVPVGRARMEVIGDISLSVGTAVLRVGGVEYRPFESRKD